LAYFLQACRRTCVPLSPSARMGCYWTRNPKAAHCSTVKSFASTCLMSIFARYVPIDFRPRWPTPSLAGITLAMTKPMPFVPAWINGGAKPVMRRFAGVAIRIRVRSGRLLLTLKLIPLKSCWLSTSRSIMLPPDSQTYWNISRQCLHRRFRCCAIIDLRKSGFAQGIEL